MLELKGKCLEEEAKDLESFVEIFLLKLDAYKKGALSRKHLLDAYVMMENAIGKVRREIKKDFEV